MPLCLEMNSSYSAVEGIELVKWTQIFKASDPSASWLTLLTPVSKDGYCHPVHIQISFFFSSLLIGLSLSLLCGIPLTPSPWIKILINLSVSLLCYSWKGKEGETKEERELWHMEPWEDRQHTSVDLLCSAHICFNAACGCDESSEPKWCYRRKKTVMLELILIIV